MKTTYSLQCTDATLGTSINLQGIWIIPTIPQRVISVDASIPNFWVAWFLFCLATPLPFSKLPKTFCSDPHPHLHEWWWEGSSLEAIIVTWGIWIRLQSHYFWILFFPLLPNHDDAFAAHIYTWQISTGPGTGDMFDIQPRCSQLPPIWSGGKQDNFLATLTLSHISRYVWYFSRDILGMSWGVQYFTLVSVNVSSLLSF